MLIIPLRFPGFSSSREYPLTVAAHRFPLISPVTISVHSGNLAVPGTFRFTENVCPFSDVVSTSGADTTTTSLPAPTAHGAMASLPDGQALFTGGLDTGAGELDQLGAFDALQTAWVFDGSAWR